MGMAAKMLKIQNGLKAPKNQYNDYGGYAYRSCEDIVNALKPLLAGENLFMYISDSVEQIGDRYYIKGKNFTQYSKVTLNGKELKTIYLGENILGLLEDVDPEEAANMKVSQIETKNKEILSTTE